MPRPIQYIVTRHAALRYIERVDDTADLREANNILRDVASRLRRSERTYKGQVVWETIDPRDPQMRLVTKHDPCDGMVLVTVLAGEEEDAADAAE